MALVRENELKENADVRIIGSSTQFGIEWNGYESWENFPSEKQKMIDLIKKTKANNLFLFQEMFTTLKYLNQIQIFILI